MAVFADPAQKTITVTNTDASETHTYAAYQVFAGNYDATTQKLTNIQWGNGVDGGSLAADLQQNMTEFAACNAAREFAQVLAGFNNEKLREFAAIVAKHLATKAAQADGDATHAAVLDVTNPGDGYYFIKDVSTNLTKDTYSDFILQVEGNVEIEAKDTTGVESFKKVKDINDSYGNWKNPDDYTDWQDSADYDIDDEVPFQLNGTVASDFDKYSSYKLVFHDKESEGLSFKPETVKAYVVNGGTRTLIDSSNYTVVTEGLNDGCTFEIRFADLKTVPGVEGDSMITVEYKSTLNENAVIGEPGNPNEMRMEYSNNPAWVATEEEPTEPTGFTPWDKVIVFTYEVIVNKVDEDGKPLDGAEFKLEKWVIDDENPTGHWVVVPGGSDGGEGGQAGGFEKINGKVAVPYTDPTTGVLFYKIRDKVNEGAAETDIYLMAADLEMFAPVIEAGKSVGVDYYEKAANGAMVKVEGYFKYSVDTIERREAGDGTKFTWKGVDDGKYKLTETKAPAGYNLLDPIEFEIVAEHEIDSADPKLISVDGNPFMPTEENMGILVAEVENVSGSTLPTTGGVGTTLFYVLGGLMVLGAGILLVVKKFSDAN